MKREEKKGVSVVELLRLSLEELDERMEALETKIEIWQEWKERKAN